MGAVVRSPEGRRRVAAPIAAAVSAAATLAWLRLITGAVTREHVITAVTAAVAGVACCWLTPRVRGFQADAAGPKFPP